MTQPTNHQPRYPLRVVIRRTGLSADVIRAWERRYGAVSPTRSEGGQRLYSEDDVVRLALLRKATSDGHSIGEIARLGQSALASLAAHGSRASATTVATARGGAAPTVADSDAQVVVAEAIAATEALDRGALESALKRAALSLGATRFIDDIAADVLRMVGDRWHAGTLAPFHEHLASDTMRRVLAWVGDAYEPARGAPTIVIATPSGESHELGAMIVAAAASEESWRVVYLGPDLPAGDIAAAARASGADVVALSLVYSSGETGVREIQEVARALPSTVTLVAGGAAAARFGAERLGPAVQVLDDVAALRTLLRARREILAVSSEGRRE